MIDSALAGSRVMKIRGDRRTNYGIAMQVLDACMLAKLHAVSMIARPEDGPR